MMAIIGKNHAIAKAGKMKLHGLRRVDRLAC